MTTCRTSLLLVLVACWIAAVPAGCASAPDKPSPAPTPAVSSAVGTASYYGRKFHGRRTASGERFNMYAMTAAHPSLPFGTQVRVTHLKTGRSVTVRINDRGPFVSGRVIDLSYAAAKRLGMLADGVVRVRLTVKHP